MPYHSLPFLLPMVIIGLGITALGAHTLYFKRPLLYRSRLHWWAMVVMFLPSIGTSLSTAFSPSHAAMLAFIVLVLAQMRQQMSGYAMMGTTQSGFYEVLHNSLNKLSIAFQERVARIELPEYGNAIELKALGGNGIVMFAFEKPDRRAEDEVIGKMKEYLVSNPVPIEKKAAWVQVAMGVGIVVMMCSIVWP